VLRERLRCPVIGDQSVVVGAAADEHGDRRAQLQVGEKSTLGVRARLPDFSWYKIPKREKYTKLLQFCSVHQIYQKTVKWTNTLTCNTLQNLPKFGLLV
jgi:hypothetical protein